MTIVYPFKALSLLVLFLWWGGEASAMDDREFPVLPAPNGMLRSTNHTTSMNHRRLALSVDFVGALGTTYALNDRAPYTSYTDNANIVLVQYTMPSGQFFSAQLTATYNKLNLQFKYNTPPADLGDFDGFVDSKTSTSATITGITTGTTLYVFASGYGTSGITNGRLRVSTSSSPTVAPTPMPTKGPTQLPTACGPSPDCGLASKVWNYFLGGR